MAHAKMQEWLQSQILNIMQATRILKTNLVMATMSEELPPATRKWLFDELVQMAQIVEVKE